MTGTFDRYDDLCNEVPGAYAELIHCITHKICIKGDCIEWLINNCPDLIVDEVYDDFKESNRWSISKAYIIAIGNHFYRCWEEVGLTEMQPNEWWDQTFKPVHQKEVTINVWAADKED